MGRKLYALFGASAGSLRIHNARESINLFEPNTAIEFAYSTYFASVDPISPATRRLGSGDERSRCVVSQDDLVADVIYHRTEFYNDFARPHGQQNMLIGSLGNRDSTMVSFFRNGAFDVQERAFLAGILPHVQRALQLRTCFKEVAIKERAAYAAFEALPGGAVIVDADLKVQFVNSAAEQLLSRGGMPISLTNVTTAPGVTRLTVSNREKASRFKALVVDATLGGSGGAVRLDFDTGQGDRIDQIAVLVSPQPPQFSSEMGGGVLILISELSRPSAPKPSLLSELFGLSIAESAVALALLGGQTAETVARERDVSLETVRSQIRTVLRKSDAANLRDFERIGALLTALAR